MNKETLLARGKEIEKKLQDLHRSKKRSKEELAIIYRLTTLLGLIRRELLKLDTIH